MTSPLPAKLSPIEWGMGHAKPSERSVTHFMIGHCPQGQPNIGSIGKRQMKTWHVPEGVLPTSSDMD